MKNKNGEIAAESTGKQKGDGLSCWWSRMGRLSSPQKQHLNWKVNQKKFFFLKKNFKILFSLFLFKVCGNSTECTEKHLLKKICSWSGKPEAQLSELPQVRPATCCHAPNKDYGGAGQRKDIYCIAQAHHRKRQSMHFGPILSTDMSFSFK
jgi:hypothetical protein